MFNGFKHVQIQTSDPQVMINLRYGGKGPGLLLLHGNPLTHATWHKIAPRLAQDFTVVASDLRGYGDSSKPRGLPDHSNYTFRRMSQDQVEVMEESASRSFTWPGMTAAHAPPFVWRWITQSGSANLPALRSCPPTMCGPPFPAAGRCTRITGCSWPNPTTSPNACSPVTWSTICTRSWRSTCTARAGLLLRQSPNTSAAARRSRSMACVRITARQRH